MSTVLLDTHVVHWWSAEPERLSDRASATLAGAEELAVAGITWYELAWLAAHGRITLGLPLHSWLQGLAAQVRTVGPTWRVAQTAASLPREVAVW